MRESTKKTLKDLTFLWKNNWPTADMCAVDLIAEIANAYKDGTVSPESCMEEIGQVLSERESAIKEWDANKWYDREFSITQTGKPTESQIEGAGKYSGGDPSKISFSPKLTGELIGDDYE